MAEGSKAKFIRDALDRAVEVKVPQVTPEEFERLFTIKVTAEEIRSMTMGELMIRQMVWKGCTGNDKSITETFDRLLGKPVQQTESVVKSYSYHDLLVELKNSENPAPAKRVVQIPAPVTAAAAPVDDLLKDFL